MSPTHDWPSHGPVSALHDCSTSWPLDVSAAFRFNSAFTAWNGEEGNGRLRERVRERKRESGKEGEEEEGSEESSSSEGRMGRVKGQRGADFFSQKDFATRQCEVEGMSEQGSMHLGLARLATTDEPEHICSGQKKTMCESFNGRLRLTQTRLERKLREEG